MDKLEIKQGSLIQQTQYFCTGQSVRWKPIFFRTELIVTGFLHRTGMFGNLNVVSININFHTLTNE
jgi:hypothetical protein